VDIGAHRGRFAIYSATLAKSGRVLAFEPDPENFQILKENVELNHLENIELFQMAVGKQSGLVLLYKNNDSSERTLFADFGSSIEVDCFSLSDVYKNMNIEHCDFFKLDCEGGEFEILFCADDQFFKQTDKIVLEYHNKLGKGKNHHDLVRLLTRRGYRLKIKRGAFYTGILFARKYEFFKNRIGRIFLLLINYWQIYFLDLISFLVPLIFKRLKEKLKVKQKNQNEK
jgi:FkbM family methyltransferase